MKDNYMDEMIKEAMSRAVPPETVQKRIETITGSIRTERKIKGGRKRFRAVWIAAAVAACSGITVFAATRYYQFQTEQKAKYELEIGVTAGDAAASNSSVLTEVPAVEMNIGFLPEGLIDNSAEKGTNSYKTADEQGGFFINDPIIFDSEEGTWSETFVQGYEKVSIGEKEALYVYIQNADDPEWLWQDLYVPFPEVNRIVLVNGWGHASKGELLKIAENISLVPNGKTEKISEQYTWSDYLAYKQTERTAGPEDEKRLTATALEMENTHHIGDSIIRETGGTDPSETLPVKITLADVQIADDLSLLTDTGQLGALEEWKTLEKEDGSLNQIKRQYKKFGDGKETMDELAGEEEVTPKLVCVTLEYSNETDRDMKDVYFFGSLMRIKEENGTYRVLTPDLKGADDVEYELWAGTGEMQYSDLAHPETGKNYIPEIKAGEAQTVHMAWLVGEDETDDLYLTMDGNWDCFTDEMLEEGLFKL